MSLKETLDVVSLLCHSVYPRSFVRFMHYQHYLGWLFNAYLAREKNRVRRFVWHLPRWGNYTLLCLSIQLSIQQLSFYLYYITIKYFYLFLLSSCSTSILSYFWTEENMALDNNKSSVMLVSLGKNGKLNIHQAYCSFWFEVKQVNIVSYATCIACLFCVCFDLLCHFLRCSTQSLPLPPPSSETCQTWRFGWNTHRL